MDVEQIATMVTRWFDQARQLGGPVFPDGWFGGRPWENVFFIERVHTRADPPVLALATAALLKRNIVKLEIGPIAGDAIGQHPMGTNLLRVDPAKLMRLESVAGATAHEAKHFLQRVTPATYRQVHEFEAYTWSRAADRTFQLTDAEIWQFIQTHPLYQGLRP